ncbi:MAG: c-type cytochrome [Acidobacteriaceae bacterium]|nr:c-type cytochrome [Acidobacteriaceae bacterium]
MKKSISFITLLGISFTLNVFLPGRTAAGTGEGAETYKAKCVACHGSDGSGNTPLGQKMKVRDLRSPDVQKQTDDELSAIIANGKPPMPGYGKSLGPEKIHDLVAYLRSIAAKS